jgi:hypothetical protein
MHLVTKVLGYCNGRNRKVSTISDLVLQEQHDSYTGTPGSAHDRPVIAPLFSKTLKTNTSEKSFPTENQTPKNTTHKSMKT